MKKKNDIVLTDEETIKLKKLASSGNTSVKQHKITQILLGVDASPKGRKCTDEEIRKEVQTSLRTITRIRKKFNEGRLEEVFRKKFTPRISRRKIDGEAEAKLIALCCSEAPEGRARWTLRLLADKVVECELTETISHETIRQTLKKTNLNLGRKKNGASLQK